LKGVWAITSYFNPVGYTRRRQNYFAFRRHLKIPLATVEVAFHDDFDLPPDAADILIRLRYAGLLWQKERARCSGPCSETRDDNARTRRATGVIAHA